MHYYSRSASPDGRSSSLRKRSGAIQIVLIILRCCAKVSQDFFSSVVHLIRFTRPSAARFIARCFSHAVTDAPLAV